MSLPEWILPFKEPRTEIKCLNNRYYKYEVSYHYSPELKRTVKKTGHLLGRITQKDGFLPSAKNKLRQDAESIPPVDIKIYGVCALFEKLLEDEIPPLISVFGKERAEQLLTFAMMRWAYQSPIKRAGVYQAHDFCSEKWSGKTLLTDKKITELLKYAGENRQMVLEWMKKLLPHAAVEGSGGFVMMDSTHSMSGSENLNVNRPGYNSSFDFGKQVRLMYMFSSEVKRPVYYRLINGNIPDIASMALCVKESGIKDAVFIADKGFYSGANIKALEEQRLKYLIPLRRNNPAIDYGPLEANGFKRSLKHFAYQKRMIWYYKYGQGGENYITFLDDRLRVEEETDYLQRIETHPDSYSEERYFEKLHSFGTLTIAYSSGVCNADGDADGARALYEAYKQRNEIETLFDSYKNFLKSDVSYMQNRFVLEGWLFTNFIAMIAYYKIFYRLREAELLSKYSPKDIIELSKSVYQMKIRGEWHLSETTAKLRKLFEKLNIGYLS